MSRRSSDFWKSLAAPVLAFMVQQAISIMWMEVYLGYKLATFHGGDYAKYIMGLAEDMMKADTLAWVSLLYAVICTVWFGIWYYRLKYNLPPEEGHGPAVVRDRAVEVANRQRGLFEGYSWTIIPGIVLLAFGGQFVINFFAEFLGSLVPAWYDFYENIMKSVGLDESSNIGVTLFLYAIIFGPICEELTFRGLCYNYLRRSTSFWAANIISSIAFGAMHMNPLQSAYAFLVGLVLGAVYEKSRNIFVTMAIHITFNLGSMILAPVMYMGDTPFKFFAILLVSLLATYVGYELVIRAIPKHIDIEIR